MRYRSLGTVVGVLAALTCGVAHADVLVPPAGHSCSEERGGVMTQLPDGASHLICVVPDCWIANNRARSDPSGAGVMQICGNRPYWAPVSAPFPPNDSWLSYGPAITLDGQGMVNPNLLSGDWTAVPQDPESTCRVQQQTVLEEGMLSSPQVSEGQQGTTLEVTMQPKLFYAELSGNCLWTRQ